MICGRGWFYWKGLLVLWTIVSTLSLDLSSCPVEDSDCKNTMKSISHNEADGSVKLETNTPIPSLKDGDVLIKVMINHLHVIRSNLYVSLQIIFTVMCKCAYIYKQYFC